VLTSPWCRCRDTARIAFGGEAQVEAALSNLFEDDRNRDRQIADFRRLVATAPRNGNLLLVTHGSTTLAFTGVSPGTAEMVIVTPATGGDFRVAGRIPLE
jgi:broad specificity phosphatase PhoE